MATTDDSCDFENWLSSKLSDLSVDEKVFCPYIISILEGDDVLQEKLEAIEGVLSEISENCLAELTKNILDKWQLRTREEPKIQGHLPPETCEELVRLPEVKKVETVKQRQYTGDELRIREKILAQYSQLSASEDECEDGENCQPSTGNMMKNTNAHDVEQALKERKEQARVDSQKKKEKDKEDREKQKQMKMEKKEKRKTVKGERRC